MDSTKRILITGAAGMLGKDIGYILSSKKGIRTFGVVRNASQRSNTHEIRECNITEYDRLEKILEEIRPDVIIHCAAVVNLDECERNHQLADAVHRDSTMVLSKYCPGATRFIYISTDSVFDGTIGPYAEDDATNPINYYAQSKLQGEKVALQSNSNSIVLRTNIYGFHYPVGKSLGEWMIESLKLGRNIDGFTDVFFNPLYTKQVARLINGYFYSNGTTGIWHLGTEELFSKYDFLIRTAKTFGLDESLISSSSIEKVKFATPRPKTTTLSVAKLKKLISTIPSVQEGLTEYCHDYQYCFPE